MNHTDFNEVFRERLMQTFKFTIDFLNSHNLRWWVAYGTAIGAVRHKGIIPWDDDIDIYMPREDYEALLDLKEELASTNYDVISLRDKNYYLYFAKIYDKKMSLVEVHRYPVNIGIYIDIFPLDSVNTDYNSCRSLCKEAKTKFLKYSNRLAQVNLSDIISLLKGFHLGTLRYIYLPILKNRFGNVEAMLLDYTSFISRINDSKGGFICNLIESEIYPKELFDRTIAMPFEDFEVNVPIGYDSILKTMYGDYMTPPKSVQQVPHHSQYYINFKERLSMEEIERRVKSGETVVIS